MMTARKLNRSQRRGFTRVLYHAFHVLTNVSVNTQITAGPGPDPWFIEALTDEEREELDKLNKMTFKLAERYRKLGWKLEGRDYDVGPPRRAKKKVRR